MFDQIEFRNRLKDGELAALRSIENLFQEVRHGDDDLNVTFIAPLTSRDTIIDRIRPVPGPR